MCCREGEERVCICVGESEERDREIGVFVCVLVGDGERKEGEGGEERVCVRVHLFSNACILW